MKNQLNKLNAYTLTDADFFIRSWEKEAINYIQRLLYWEREEAQTLYHDACLIVIDQLKKGRIESVGKGYLFTTCKNLGANSWRKAQRNKKKYEQYCQEEQSLFEKTISEKYGIKLFDQTEVDERTESKKALRAFSLLTSKCQQVIALKYVDGKSHHEISDDVDELNTANSAKTTLSRCIKYWKRKFKELS